MYADLFTDYTHTKNKEGTKILVVSSLEIKVCTYCKQQLLNLNSQKEQTVETVIIRFVFLHVSMY
jgi:hypothetical protein